MSWGTSRSIMKTRKMKLKIKYEEFTVIILCFVKCTWFTEIKYEYTINLLFLNLLSLVHHICPKHAVDSQIGWIFKSKPNDSYCKSRNIGLQEILANLALTKLNRVIIRKITHYHSNLPEKLKFPAVKLSWFTVLSIWQWTNGLTLCH